MDESTRLKALEAAVQAKIDADAAFQDSVNKAFADLKAKIPDSSGIDAELTALEAEVAKFQPLTIPTG